MRIHHLAWVVLVGLCSCAHAPQSSTKDMSPAPGAVTALTTRSAELDPSAARRARLEVIQAEGVPAGRLQTLFEPAAEQLHRCIPGRSPGKVVLRVTSRDGVLGVTAEPGVSLDASAQSCALDALSTVYLPQTGTNTGGTSIPPSGFTSILTVVW